MSKALTTITDWLFSFTLKVSQYWGCWDDPCCFSLRVMEGKHWRGDLQNSLIGETVCLSFSVSFCKFWWLDCITVWPILVDPMQNDSLTENFHDWVTLLAFWPFFFVVYLSTHIKLKSEFNDLQLPTIETYIFEDPIPWEVHTCKNRVPEIAGFWEIAILRLQYSLQYR